jgi:serine/threonine-protein kinase
METERNLLFGVLALQLELLDCRQFADVCCGWAARKGESLADLLVARGWLTPIDRAEIERLLERKLRRHGGDARASLADLWGGFLRDALAEVDDPDVRKSLDDLVAPIRPERCGGFVVAVPDPDQARYSLIRLHARGGIGQVWLAQDRTLDRDVALKELQPGRGDSPIAWARFLREAKITGLLEHPGIVPIYDLAYRPPEVAGKGAPAAARAFYTMRFIQGRTLHEAARDYHRRRALGRSDAMALRELVVSFLSVCNTMAYAHSRGIVHRDLKGGNIVLGDFGEVFVLDWGLAKVVAGPASIVTATWMEGQEPVAPPSPGDDEAVDLTLDGQVLGTPGFMAPEQAESRLDLVNQRTDIYGLGAVLYEVLTGQAPFHGESTFDVLRRIVNETVRPPRALVPDTPPALEAICLKAVAKRPEERYDSVTTLARDLRSWLADEPVSVCREPLPRRLGRWVRRHRTLVAAAGVVFMICLVALSASTVLIGLERDAKARAYSIANDQRQRAEASSRTAVAAVERYLTDVGGSKELQSYGLEPLRQRLLAGAREFYEQFLRDQPDDPARRDDLGRATYRLAETHNVLGDVPKAEELYEKARDLLDTPTEGPPATRNRRASLADVTNSLAGLQFGSGRHHRAEANWQRSLALRDRLAREQPENDGHKEGMAQVHNNLGKLYRDRQLWDRSEAAYRTALSIYEGLARDHAADLDFREKAAVSYSNLGNLAMIRRLPKEAAELTDRAIDILRELIAGHPGVETYRSRLANTLTSKGEIERQAGRPAGAKAAWVEARTLLEPLERDHPLVPFYRLQLANVLINIAAFVEGPTDPAQAERTRDRSTALLDRLFHDHPEVDEYRSSYGTAQNNAANVLHLRGQVKASLSHYDTAIEVLGGLLPRSVGARDHLRMAYQNRGQALSKLGRHADGLRDLDRAIELDDQKRIELPLLRAVILARTGDHAQAAAAADGLAQRARPALEVLGNLACVYSLASAAARKGERAPGVVALGRSLADRYADRAIDQLDKAREAGLLVGRAMAEKLATDPDLEAIRSDTRFRTLLETIRLSPKSGHAGTESKR